MPQSSSEISDSEVSLGNPLMMTFKTRSSGSGKVWSSALETVRYCSTIRKTSTSTHMSLEELLLWELAWRADWENFVISLLATLSRSEVWMNIGGIRGFGWLTNIN